MHLDDFQKFGINLSQTIIDLLKFQAGLYSTSVTGEIENICAEIEKGDYQQADKMFDELSIQTPTRTTEAAQRMRSISGLLKILSGKSSAVLAPS